MESGPPQRRVPQALEELEGAVPDRRRELGLVHSGCGQPDLAERQQGVEVDGVAHQHTAGVDPEPRQGTDVVLTPSQPYAQRPRPGLLPRRARVDRVEECLPIRILPGLHARPRAEGGGPRCRGEVVGVGMPRQDRLRHRQIPGVQGQECGQGVLAVGLELATPGARREGALHQRRQRAG